MSRYALILFDEDGMTSIVETRRLYGYKELKQSVRCNFGLFVGPQYKVEILQVSDTEQELNDYEVSWSQSHRALALDEEKRKRKKERNNQLHGFLSVWPEKNVIEVNEQEQDSPQNDTVPASKITLGKRKERNTTASRGRPKKATREARAVDRRMEVQRSISAIAATSSVSAATGDDDVQQLQQTQTAVSDGENNVISVEEFGRNVRSFGTQCKDVIIVEHEAELNQLVRKDRVEKAVQCNFVESENIMKTLEKHGELLVGLTNAIRDIKDKLERNDGSLSVSVMEELVGLKPHSVPLNRHDIDNIVSTCVSIEPAKITGISDENSDDNSDENSVTTEIRIPTAVQPNSLNIFIPETTEVNADQTAAVSLMNLASLITSPTQNLKGVFSNPCYSTSIVEIQSAADVPLLKDFELRISQDLQRKCKLSACSVGNFGRLLVRAIFTPEELIGRNYNGRKGKNSLCSRRVHAIEHAAYDMYGYGENVKLLANAINTALRNMKDTRGPLVPVCQNTNG